MNPYIVEPSLTRYEAAFTTPLYNMCGKKKENDSIPPGATTLATPGCVAL
jgi:hypothetical protein